MADGSERAIETVQAGDLVLAFDPSSQMGRGALVPKRVVRSFVNVAQAVYDLHGLFVTQNHVFLSERGTFETIADILARNGAYIDEAGQAVRARTGFAVGSAQDQETLSRKTGPELIVYSAQNADRFEQAQATAYAIAGSSALKPQTTAGWKTYNFEVEAFHTYVAGGVRVHNDSLQDYLELSLMMRNDAYLAVAFGEIKDTWGESAAAAAAYGDAPFSSPDYTGHIGEMVGAYADAVARGDFETAEAIRGGLESVQSGIRSADYETEKALAENPDSTIGDKLSAQDKTLDDNRAAIDAARDAMDAIDAGGVPGDNLGGEDLGEGDEDPDLGGSFFAMPAEAFSAKPVEAAAPKKPAAPKIPDEKTETSVIHLRDGTTFAFSSSAHRKTTTTLKNGYVLELGETIVQKDGTSREEIFSALPKGGLKQSVAVYSADGELLSETVTVNQVLISAYEKKEKGGFYTRQYSAAGVLLHQAFENPDGTGWTWDFDAAKKEAWKTRKTYFAREEKSHEWLSLESGVEEIRSYGYDVRLYPAVDTLKVMATGRNGTGNDRNNVMIGNGLDNVLRAAGGNDVVEGRDGQDMLEGGAGEDRLKGGAGDDELRGLDGTDVLLGGIGQDTLYGHSGADRLYGEDGNDILLGGAGDDRLKGGLGIDRLHGEAGNDVLVGGAGADMLFGDEGDDRLEGEAGDDLLKGGAGADTLSGGAGDDEVRGEAGNDALEGGAGDDKLWGASGNDSLSGGVGNDVLEDGLGDDRLEGGEGDDKLFGGDGSDVLVGGAGSDQLFGGAGDDILIGGDGVDFLEGGLGRDIAVLTGRRSDYLITLHVGSQHLTLDDRRSGAPDGLDLAQVEVFRFSDGDIDLSALNAMVSDERDLAWNVTDSDGSLTRLVYEVDAGNPSLWQVRIERFTAAGARLSETLFFSDGSRKASAFDVLNQKVWSSSVQSFDTAGLLTKQADFNDDKTSKETLWDAEETQAWERIEMDYNAAAPRQMVKKTVFNDDNSSSQEFWDPQNFYDWAYQRLDLDEHGLKLAWRFEFNDGSVSLERWNVPGFEKVTNQYDADGDETLRYLDYGGGKATEILWDRDDKDPWQEKIFRFEKDNRVQEETLNDDGSKIVLRLDPNGDADWKQIASFYADAEDAHSLTREDTHYDDGSQSVSEWDVSGEAWSERFVQFGTAGAADTKFFERFAYDDHTMTEQEWDIADDGDWADIFRQYNAVGTLISTRTTYDNGDVVYT